jgi:hypothetical protein
MNDPEKFLQRWSRRKIEAENEEQPKADSSAEHSSAPPAAPAKNEPPVFDPELLPSLESIDATTDIRAFLAPGVPEELKRAALKRAWLTDPGVRDFVELLENSWDFNDPNGAHGFGPLEVTEKIKKAVEAMFDPRPEEHAREEKLADVSSSPSGVEAARPQPAIGVSDQISGTDRESDREPARAASPQTGKKISNHNPQHGHGGALPK